MQWRSSQQPSALRKTWSESGFFILFVFILMTSCLRMEIKILLFLPERSFATATNSFDFVSFLFSPFAINLHSRIGVLWSVRQLLFGLELELVSKELNHFGGIASFFQDWTSWKLTGGPKPLFMRHLSVSLVPNLKKTTRSPQSDLTPWILKPSPSSH